MSETVQSGSSRLLLWHSGEDMLVVDVIEELAAGNSRAQLDAGQVRTAQLPARTTEPTH